MSDQDDKNCHPCHDHGEDPGVRNRYYRHKAMTAEDFRKEQDYMIERRRLINRAVIGWGVLNGGLKVIRSKECPADDNISSPAPVPVHVTQGVGLDQKGREIVVVEDSLPLTGQNTFIREAKRFVDLHKGLEGKFVLRIHYAEEDVGESYLPSTDCFAKPERRYVRESVVFSLTSVESVGEEGCDHSVKELVVIDRASLSLKNSELLNKVGPEAGTECPQCANDEPCAPGVLDLRIDLDDWNNGAPIEAGELCAKNGLRISPEGLVLGVLEDVRFDNCSGVLATAIKCTDLRRIAKSNDLLYALQLGWNLTRITGISWWSEQNSATGVRRLADFISEAQGGLTIKFSKPIKKFTKECISVQFTTSVGADSGWHHNYIAPICNIQSSQCKKFLKISFEDEWFKEITSPSSIFKHEGATVTIEIYGDLILDENELPVDANARGLGVPGIKGFQTGNGTPGGTFRCSFKVGQYEPQSRQNT